MSISPQTFGKASMSKESLFLRWRNATCTRSENVSFSRLLLNAPQVHSRYAGKFKGLVIAELALFRHGKSVYEFDRFFERSHSAGAEGIRLSSN